MPATLTAKQEAFALQYTIDHNATQAAVRAGYSENGARQAGHRLLTSADIRQRIAELEREANAEIKTKARLSRQQLLQRLLEISETSKSDSVRLRALTVLLDHAEIDEETKQLREMVAELQEERRSR